MAQPVHRLIDLTSHMPRLRGHACSRAGIITFVIAGALVAAACSGSGGGKVAAGSTASPSSASSSSNAAFQAYRDCLAQHGVTLPQRQRNQSSQSGASDASGPPSDQSGGPGRGFNGQFSLPPGVDQSTFDAAMQACANLRPAGGGGGGRGGAAGAAYRSCLADHGVTVPSTSSGGPPPSIDRNDPNFASANQVCRALLPNRGQNGSPSSSSSDASASSAASTSS